MTLYGVDWGHGKNKLVTWNGSEEQRWQNLTQLLHHLTPGDHVHLESTFESFEVQKVEDVLKLAAERKIKITVTAPRTTAWWRKKHQIEKSDGNDAKVLFEIATSGKHLRTPLGSKTQSAWQKEPELYRRYITSRTNEYKDEFAADMINLQPSPKECPFPCLLANGKYNPTHVVDQAMCAAQALAHGGGRKEFERCVGLYENGYPSVFRSNRYHHQLNAMRRQAAGQRSQKGVVDDEVRRACLKEIRRASRWIFKMVSLKTKGLYAS